MTSLYHFLAFLHCKRSGYAAPRGEHFTLNVNNIHCKLNLKRSCPYCHLQVAKTGRAK